MKLDKDHIFLISSQDIKDICKPLFQHFGFISFMYQKNFDDGSEIRLGTHADWLVHFFEQEYFQHSVFEGKPSQYKAGQIILNNVPTHGNILSAARDFHIDHAFTLVRPQTDGCEFYFLGSESSNQKSVQLALDNIPLLNRFLLYFKEKSNDIIEKAAQNKIFLPQKYKNLQTMEVHIERLSMQLDKTQFINDIHIKHYPLSNGQALSRREFQVAEQLVQGFSAKEIANKLFVSPRTVESHIDNLRLKFNCNSRSELINHSKLELSEYL